MFGIAVLLVLGLLLRYICCVVFAFVFKVCCMFVLLVVCFCCGLLVGVFVVLMFAA